MTTTLLLPEPIAAYFAADPRDTDAIARCFTAQAVVKDEGHTFAGLDAIRAWKARTAAAFAYTSEPLAMEQSGGSIVVTSRVTGSFPGSPVDLRYRFGLANGLIESLEIGA